MTNKVYSILFYYPVRITRHTAAVCHLILLIVELDQRHGVFSFSECQISPNQFEILKDGHDILATVHELF